MHSKRMYATQKTVRKVKDIEKMPYQFQFLEEKILVIVLLQCCLTFPSELLYFFSFIWLVFNKIKLKIELHTVRELKDWPNSSVWSKTTLITGGVGRTGVDPPSYKTDTFFLRSLALSVSIYRNFQSNGGKC